MTVAKMSDKKRPNGRLPFETKATYSAQPGATGLVRSTDHAGELNPSSLANQPGEPRANDWVPVDDSRGSLIERWDRQVHGGEAKKPQSVASKSNRRLSSLGAQSPVADRSLCETRMQDSEKGISLFGVSARPICSDGRDSLALTVRKPDCRKLNEAHPPDYVDSPVNEVDKLLLAEALRVARHQAVDDISPVLPSKNLQDVACEAKQGQSYTTQPMGPAAKREARKFGTGLRQAVEVHEKVRQRAEWCKAVPKSEACLAHTDATSRPNGKTLPRRKRKALVTVRRQAKVFNSPERRWRSLVGLTSLGLLGFGMSAFFERSVDDAKIAAAQSSINTIRTAISRYRADHGVLPGVRASAGATCVADAVAGSGPAGSLRSFVEQLTRFTNEFGHTCTLPGEAFVHGPYLKSATLPDEPFSLSNELTLVVGAEVVASSQLTSSKGWTYNIDTGEFGPSRDFDLD